MNRRLSIAMVAAMPFPSGQGTQALVGELASGLSRRGHRVHLVCYHHRGIEREEPFAIHRTPKLPFYKRLRSGPDPVKPAIDCMLVVKTIQVIRRFGCRLVHAHNYEGALAGWIAARMCGLPLVYHAHNIMEDELPSYFRSFMLSEFFRLIGMALDRTVPGLARRVITLHNVLSRELQARGVPGERIRVIQPGIDVRFWGSGVFTKDSVPTVIYTGNLDVYQDLPTLFTALPEVVSKVPGTRLLLATPNSVTEAERLVESFDASAFTEVIFTPGPEETRRALCRAMVAVCPRSSWSGYPIKNLNAQATGRPVVACQGSAFGIEHEKTGLVVADRDSRAFASALIKLLKDPKRAALYGANAQKQAHSRFGLKKMLQEVELVYSTLC